MVQEIVNKVGWVSGNLIRLIIVPVTTGGYQSNDVNAAGNYSNVTNVPSYSGTYNTATNTASIAWVT